MSRLAGVYRGLVQSCRRGKADTPGTSKAWGRWGVGPVLLPPGVLADRLGRGSPGPLYDRGLTRLVGRDGVGAVPPVTPGPVVARGRGHPDGLVHAVLLGSRVLVLKVGLPSR